MNQDRPADNDTTLPFGQGPPQADLFEKDSPADVWDRDVTRRALDELYKLACHYNTSRSYFELLRFVKRFRSYSPFNAMLMHVQMPGARFVAPPSRWQRDYHRQIRAGARPLVILQPMGPVMFVFDVSDTEPMPGTPELPLHVINPFEVRSGQIHGELERTIENARRDGINVAEQSAGSQHAGQIGSVNSDRRLRVTTRLKPDPEYTFVRVRYELLLNSNLSEAARYATLVHELGHLYCGHLGTPNEKWWPDRRGLSHENREFEAESACYLVCSRLGIDNPSDEYLAGYLRGHAEIPSISLDCVMKAAGLIEQMGRGRMGLRKEKE